LPFGFSLGVGFGVARIGSTGRAGAVPIGCGVAFVAGAAVGASVGLAVGEELAGTTVGAGAGAFAGSVPLRASGDCANIVALITIADAAKMIFFICVCFISWLIG